MKSFKFLSYITLVMFFILFFTGSVFSQEKQDTIISTASTQVVDPIDSLQQLVNQLKSVAPSSGENLTLYLWLFFSILGGITLHTIVNTFIAVKYNQLTPNYFSPSYWFNENLAYKISLILGFILTLPYINKISEYIIDWWGKAILILFGILIGWFIDFLTGKLQSLLKLKASIK